MRRKGIRLKVAAPFVNRIPLVLSLIVGLV